MTGDASPSSNSARPRASPRSGGYIARMTFRTKPALFMVGVTALTVIIAPVADARPTCQSTHTTSICQTNGSVSIKARPGTVAPPGNMPHIPWFGFRGGRRR